MALGLVHIRGARDLKASQVVLLRERIVARERFAESA